MSTTATIFNIQRFSIHDGPGTRTTVFFKGCNLSCRWCHNPESQSGVKQVSFTDKLCVNCGDCAKACPNCDGQNSALFTDLCTSCGECITKTFCQARELIGYDISLDELMEQIEKDVKLYEISGGGVTFSGGEPFLQSDFLLDALKICKEKGIHTAVETACCVPFETIKKCAPYIDLFFCDIKTMDSQKHKEYTGAPNELILQNIKKLCEIGANVVIRTPIVPDFNDDEQSVSEICEFLNTLTNLKGFQLLEFHNWCGAKYKAINRVFEYENKMISAEKFNQLKGIVNTVCKGVDYVD